MKNYEVKIYYSTFCTFEIIAESEKQAINKARKLESKKNEVLSNLENWEEADEVFEIEYKTSK